MSKLTVHTRLHLAADGATHVAPFVRCPTDRRWASVEACRRCPDVKSVEGIGSDAVVECKRSPAYRCDPARTPVSEAMELEVLTVTADVAPEDVARALDARNLAVAIVVDEAAHPIGVCSRVDVVRADKASRVDQVMTPFVITLLSNATIADAVDLILARDLHHIPVLGEGRIVGVVSATAALRWFTQNLRAARRRRARDAKVP